MWNFRRFKRHSKRKSENGSEAKEMNASVFFFFLITFNEFEGIFQLKTKPTGAGKVKGVGRDENWQHGRLKL